MLSALMVRVNVELKARDGDPARTAERCLALGAADQGVLVQRDTYFAAARGRLKLRELGDGAELIAYRRPDGEEPAESSYVLAPVPAAASQLNEALDAALGTTVVVAKKRRLFFWEGVRIHLDDVDGLGTFIELEAVLPDAGDLQTAQAKVARLRASLLIADDALVATGYANLLLDGPEQLLRAAGAVMPNAYVPYSQFKVGAALRGRSGAIYAAANVENAAYPQSQCAEASAIGVMAAAGEYAIAAVAVVAERIDICPPCGGCRQRLSEFGAGDTPVYLGRPGGAYETLSLAELLPHSFGPDAL
jgi:homotetrameric cytidine deaminase